MNQVRLDPDIRGLGLPGSQEEAKMSCYADDSTAILTTLKSISHVINKCTLFGKASGSKLNVPKTKGMFWGKWKTRSDHPFGISWVKSAKLLGARLGNILTEDDKWGDIFSPFVKSLETYMYRKLSSRGKTYVINILGS